MRKPHLTDNNTRHKPGILALVVIMLAALFLPARAMAVGENCTVSVLNRTATVQPNGTWTLRNVPSGLGQVRARMTCVVNGKTISGQSDYFTVSSNGVIDVGDVFFFNEFKEVPNALSITTPTTTLTAIGATAQLTVTATYPSTATADVTAGVKGTTYLSTNPAIATVSADGLVSATGTGKVIITASNEMVLSSVLISVVQANNPDSDGDGLPDAWEIANGLNPNDPVDALKDPDEPSPPLLTLSLQELTPVIN